MGRNIKSSVKTASAQITAYGGKLRDAQLFSDGANAGWARLINGTPITLDYDSGGAATPTIGETITGATSTRTGILVAYTTASGTWGGGDAAGVMTIMMVTGGTLFTNNELLTGSTSGVNMATADGTGDAGDGGTEIISLKVSATASDSTSFNPPSGRSFGALYLYADDIGSISIGYTDSA